MVEVSPFTTAVVSSMRKLYPETLADKSFDNTGLMLEAPYQPQLPRKANSVLLAIDLTRAVADEAIEGNHSVVVAYHPIIFRGLKSITFADTQQTSLLRLAANGISVYSPHTAVDIVPGGMGDWLCDIVTGKLDAPEPEARTATQEGGSSALPQSSHTPSDSAAVVEQSHSEQQPAPKSTGPASRPKALQRTYSKPSYISYPETPNFHPNTIPHTRSVITSSPSSDIQSANSLVSNNNSPSASSTSTPEKYTSSNTGAGRLIRFHTPQPLSKLITRIAAATNHPKGFQIAIPQSASLEDIHITTVGVCPGSGASVLAKPNPKPDLYFTGEMSHHEALAIIEKGGSIIALNHSNSERGYLNAVMKDLLCAEVKDQWARMRKDQNGGGGGGKDGEGDENLKQMLNDDTVDVVVSERDRDPFGIVILEESNVGGQTI